MKKKNAFTLAEVLITLGIIGIVAAMTMPILIQKNNNRVVETRLMKFYSAINQAVKMAEVDYGDKKYWFEDLSGAEIDDEGNPVQGSSEQEKWFNKYLAPYLKIIKTETLSDGALMVYFPDGSAMQARSHTTRDWWFYPGDAKKCLNQYNNGINSIGRCVFLFNFQPTDTNQIAWKYHINKGFEPWKYYWDGTETQLKQGCAEGGVTGSMTPGGYCTALIQYNGWKIPADYPWKVSY